MIEKLLSNYKVEGYYFTLLELKELFELCFNVKDIFIGHFPQNEGDWSGIIRYDIKKELQMVTEEDAKCFYFYSEHRDRLIQLCNEDIIPEGIYFIYT